MRAGSQAAKKDKFVHLIRRHCFSCPQANGDVDKFLPHARSPLHVEYGASRCNRWSSSRALPTSPIKYAPVSSGFGSQGRVPYNMNIASTNRSNSEGGSGWRLVSEFVFPFVIAVPSLDMVF